MTIISMDHIPTRDELKDIYTKEMAKLFREHFKVEFPGVKFSVTIELYSGGSSITVSVMKADRRMILPFDQIPEEAIMRAAQDRYTEDMIRKSQTRSYHQLGNFYDRYDRRFWNNGVYLTYQGYMMMMRVEQITNHYKRGKTPYIHLQLGRYDKPFVDGVGFKDDPMLYKRIEDRKALQEAHYEKTRIEKEEKDALDRLESESHMAKDKKLREKVRSIMQSHAIIDGNGFNDIRTVEAKAKKLAEIDDLRQIFKVKGIDWSKELLEL